jgi:hypothetical protein
MHEIGRNAEMASLHDRSGGRGTRDAAEGEVVS